MKKTKSILHTLTIVSYGSSFVALFAIALLSISTFFLDKNSLENIRSTQITANVISAGEIKDLESFLSEDEIQAQSLVVIDVNKEKTIFEKNGDRIMPLASLTKLVTALVAYELLPSHQIVTPTFEDILTEGDYKIELGDSFMRDQAIQFMLVESANDLAEALARTTGTVIGEQIGRESAIQWFISKMNSKSDELGLSSLNFKNPSGLDEGGETIVGSTGSAVDIAKLYLYILENYPRLLDLSTKSYINIRSLNNKTFLIKNTNPYLDELYQPIGSKTGFTNLAGGNLGVVINTDINKPYIIVVLGSTKDGRFRDVELIQEAILSYQQQYQ